MFEFDELEAVTLASLSRAAEPKCRGLHSHKNNEIQKQSWCFEQ